MQNQFIFPKFFWHKLSEILAQDTDERAFYLIGSEWGNKVLIYDLVEFNYEHRSPTYVESSVHQKSLLINALPIGVKIIGVLHSHPFTSSKPRFSQIDLRDFEEYDSGLFIVVSKTLEYTALYRDGENVDDAVLEIRDLEPDEDPVIFTMKKRWKIVIPKGMTKWEIERYVPIYFSEKVSREILLGKVSICDNALDFQFPLYLDIIKSWAPYKIPYRIYFRHNVNFKSQAKKLIKELFNYHNCDLRFIPSKREIHIMNCSGWYI